MKTITVVSGKGGTGKTSLTAALAALGNPVVLADCDVDAANLHLAVPHEKRKTNPFHGEKVARFLPDQCIRCGICLDVCRFEALSGLEVQRNPADDFLVIDPLMCEGCGVCAHVCPVDAIEMTEKQSGEWFLSDTGYGPMVHAKLGIGAENSGRLVTIVRNFANGIAQSGKGEFVIVDGSPGVGCPVISSLTGADFAVAVTEPTQSGRHDLERIRDLTAHFAIPTGVVINKWDLNLAMSEEIERWIDRSPMEMLGRIPYDPAFVQAQLDGRPVVEGSDNGLKDTIAGIWRRILQALQKDGSSVPVE
ncbi:4Fe-4S dicluster domain-containing protein [bacterium]|nr:4Fe-4S dicluster domain-containing protein [bacterium]